MTKLNNRNSQDDGEKEILERIVDHFHCLISLEAVIRIVATINIFCIEVIILAKLKF